MLERRFNVAVSNLRKIFQNQATHDGYVVFGRKKPNRTALANQRMSFSLITRLSTRCVFLSPLLNEM